MPNYLVLISQKRTCAVLVTAASQEELADVLADGYTAADLLDSAQEQLPGTVDSATTASVSSERDEPAPLRLDLKAGAFVIQSLPIGDTL